jgi:hypothetical protein
MPIKVVTQESNAEYERKVNELLASGWVILSCGAHAEAFWAILEKE